MLNCINAASAAKNSSTHPAFASLCPGRISYRNGLALQEHLLTRRQELAYDILLLLEHDPVITLGRGADAGNLLISAEELARLGVELHRVSRGGDVTYHGPGQLVGYPIIDLSALGRDLHRYLRRIEELLCAIAAHFGIHATTTPGKTGIWVKGEKLASIGVGVRRWISWHGFALNVASDLSGFDAIVPCGLSGVRMTSLERLLDRPVPLQEVVEVAIREFARVFSSTYLGNYDNQIT